MGSLSLGLDFGTESVRALLVDTKTGEECGEGISRYSSGVMDRELKGRALPPEFALQNAQDYLDSMTIATRAALAEMRRSCPDRTAREIIGIGLDFTASSPLPIAEDGSPLSARFPHQPHAYVKLWKHHAAQKHADFINEHAPMALLERYGGAISCEWSLPKLMEFEASAPELFAQTHAWVEAGDWVVSILAGRADRPVRSTCQAGYKGLWSQETGYPAPEFLKRCSPAIADRFERLMGGPIQPLGSKVGGLSADWAAKLGLPEGVAVATAAIDAHAGVPGSGVVEPGSLLCVVGTSTCHMALSTKQKYILGIAGSVADGIIPGLVGLEAGQPAVGDLFSWFVKLTGKPLSEASFAELEAAASDVPPGSNGVTALDWWNGNRSVLMDASMKGTFAGLRLTTTHAEQYRALVEATAFGTKVIVDTLSDGGVAIDHVILTGGIATKSPLLCQIYADTLGLPVQVVQARQPVALGAAIYGAAAAGASKPAAFAKLVQAMTVKMERTKISPTRAAEYKKPYARYRKLHDLMHEYYRATLD